MSWMIIFFAVVAAVIALAVWGSAKLQEENAAAESKLKEKFGTWNFVRINQRVVGVSADGREFMVGGLDLKKLSHKDAFREMLEDPRFIKGVGVVKTYPIADLVSVEVLRNGASIEKTNRGSQALGAVVGAVALGGVGLLLGGLTGSKTSRETVTSIDLKLIVDDPADPVQTIEFFNSASDKGAPLSDLALQKSIESVEKVHAWLVTALQKAPPLAVAEVGRLQSRSAADEIERLWELRQSGALTEAEFNTQKARVFGAD